MDSYQGLMGRKLLSEIGQELSMATGSSSSPSPFRTNPESKPVTAITIAFIIATIFLLGFLSVHCQRCYIRRGRSGHLRTALYNPSGTAQGLDVSIIETLPKVIFSSSVQLQKKEKKKHTTECVICLEEFEDQETLRLLPQCGHAFHLECINMWLFSHSNCPLCRHSLLQPDTIAIAVASPNDVSNAANSVPCTESRQIRVPGNPSEEGESSENRAELWRSHSMGHSIVKAGFILPASSSSSLLSFTVHRSSSCTVLWDLGKLTSEGV